MMKEQFDDIEKQLWESLGEIKNPNPSPEMKTRFHAMLDTFKAEEEEKKERFYVKFIEQFKQVFTYKPAYNWAYAMIILALGGLIGFYAKTNDNQAVASKNEIEKLSSEVQDMKQMMMLTMLKNPTATERLKAVSYTQELSTVDDKIIDALLTTLNSDHDPNVRLVTVEALVELADNPKVRKGLVLSLLKQDSPLVQVALADAMVRLQEKSSVKQFKKLLQKENLNDAVKGKIEHTIMALS